jgi:ribosome-associated protein
MRRRQLPGEPPPPTKTELKRQSQAVQDLADRLIEAPEEVLAGMELPEKLADAVTLARGITSHGARLRQRLFVGKLLRGLDPEPIRRTLDAAARDARIAAVRFRRAERWRGELIARGPGAAAEFLAEYPVADRERLLALLAAAAAEHRSGRSGAAARELFRFLRQHL